MCFHCGGTETIKYPACLDFVAGVMKVFARIHRKCKETASGKELREWHRKEYEKFKLDQAEREKESGSVPDQVDGEREGRTNEDDPSGRSDL